MQGEGSSTCDGGPWLVMCAQVQKVSQPSAWWYRWSLRLVRSRRIWRFCVVGLIGVGINTLALFLLHGVAKMPLLLASALAVEIAIAHNYVLNEVWTFPSQRPAPSVPAQRRSEQVRSSNGRPTPRRSLARRWSRRPHLSQLALARFAKFNLAALVALVVNVVVVRVLVGLGVFYLVANLIGICAALAINLTVSTTWIWGGRTDGVAHLRSSGSDIAPSEHSGGAHPLPDDLHVGPAGRGATGEGSRAARRTTPLVHRDPAGPPRRGSHSEDHRTPGSQQLPGHHAPGPRGLFGRRHRDHRAGQHEDR